MQTRCRLVRYRDLRPLLDLLCRLTVSESDDTLIFMEGEETQVVNLKNILQTFSISTGLKVNYFKSMLVLINISDEETLTLTQSFGCSVGSLPFTYLGLLLGLTKPKVIDFLPMVSRCENRLSCTSAFLSQAGRLEVTNAIFTALSMYFMCTFSLYKTVIKKVINIESIVSEEVLISMPDPHQKQPGSWFVYQKLKVV